MQTACVFVPSPQHVYPGHPEEPGRFARLGNWDSKPYTSNVSFVDPQPASIKEITAVHTERMVRALKDVCRQGPGVIDYAPTFVTSSSFSDALAAAGGTLTCTRAVMAGTARNAFAIVRPPGHHAEPDRPMGFCLFNNVAIAVRNALANGIRKALIFDFDAHHGNGTQAAFWGQEGVAYFSTHQEGIYPGSGRMDEAPHARGRMINLPLPPRAGDASFALIAGQVLAPLAGNFRPEMIFVSAGFDSHWNDPITTLGLSSAGYFALSQRLVEMADQYCGGKIVFVLEGGYNPANVAMGVDAVLSALTGTGFTAADPSPYPEPEIQDRLDVICRLHKLR